VSDNTDYLLKKGTSSLWNTASLGHNEMAVYEIRPRLASASGGSDVLKVNCDACTRAEHVANDVVDIFKNNQWFSGLKSNS